MMNRVTSILVIVSVVPLLRLDLGEHGPGIQHAVVVLHLDVVVRGWTVWSVSRQRRMRWERTGRNGRLMTRTAQRSESQGQLVIIVLLILGEHVV